MSFLRALLSDLAKLRLPVTAGAVLATALALGEPFGISLGGDATAKVTGALAAIGVISAYLNDRLGGVEVATNPATVHETVVYREHAGSLGDRVAADQRRIGRLP